MIIHSPIAFCIVTLETLSISRMIMSGSLSQFQALIIIAVMKMHHTSFLNISVCDFQLLNCTQHLKNQDSGSSSNSHSFHHE